MVLQFLTRLGRVCADRDAMRKIGRSKFACQAIGSGQGIIAREAGLEGDG